MQGENDANAEVVGDCLITLLNGSDRLDEDGYVRPRRGRHQAGQGEAGMRYGTYFENPGMPTEAERGTYCPDGEKIAEFPAGQPQDMQAIEPWPCGEPWCTQERFEQARSEMEAELAEADKHAWGCALGPGHKEPCDGEARPERM
jgi:hypothetical protein